MHPDLTKTYSQKGRMNYFKSKSRKWYRMKHSKANDYNEFISVKNLQLKFEIWEKSLCNNRIKTQES